MRAGALDSVVKIQVSAEDAISAAGTPSESWIDLATVRAQIIQASTEEFIRNGASDVTVTIFRIRYLSDVTTSCRVVYDGTVHNIKELKEIGRAKGLDIRTVMQGEVMP